MAAVAAVVLILTAHNLVGNLRVPERWYVPVNLATAAIVVGAAAAAGVTVEDLGLSAASLGPGLRVGAIAGLVVVAAVATATMVPVTRPWVADRRMAGVGARGTLWRAAVRIPLGTVVLEEVAFRGALPALLTRVISVDAALVVASVLFGLWHVVPTVKTLDINRVATGGRPRILAVLGAVAFTTVVGIVLCRLRLATGSLAAPALVHLAANSSATVAAYLVLRRRASA